MAKSSERADGRDVRPTWLLRAAPTARLVFTRQLRQQKVVGIIKGDKAKTQTYCQVNDIAKQMDEAVQEKDRKKAEELSQKLTESETNLGPEYLALVESLRNMDLTSKDGQEIVSTFDKLDESCPH